VGVHSDRSSTLSALTHRPEKRGAYGHGEFGEPDREVESIPIFLDFRLEGFEGCTVNMDCYIIWSVVGREDIHESLAHELRFAG
jgi:hypothetical protein